MQRFNYHSHTKRCGHASGEDEEYVKQAIKNGYTCIGFSDHAPYENGYVEGERMRKDEFNDYVQSVHFLQEKYKDQIEIRLGLEIEYFEDFLDEIKEYRNLVDFMILGEHEYAVKQIDFYMNHKDEDTLLNGEQVAKACDDGLVDIVAHPDLFMFSKEEWNEACEKTAHKICQSAERNHALLELNLNGLRYGKRQIGDEYRYTYPYRKFWEVVSQYDIEVVYGLDAHTPDKYADFACYETVNEIIEGIPLKFRKELKFK